MKNDIEIENDWEEKHWSVKPSDNAAKRQQYPLTEQECYLPMPEAMFPIPELPQAWDYFIHYRTKPIHADTFFSYLYRLEKDVALNQQRTQPDSI